MLPNIKIALLLFCCFGTSLTDCKSGQQSEEAEATVKDSVQIVPIPVAKPLRVGAERMEIYLPKLQNQTIALIVNQTSMVGPTHLVDTLLSKGVIVRQLFAPEHGFRGEADAGEQLADGKDVQTGLPVTSLYGKKKKPSAEDLEGISMVIFDIQDVGARFYTYISTMHYVMEACAEQDIQFLVMDRPNPNGHYVDGPILEPGHQSFVGMHPVPVVHGMTIAEYARMINAEGWLANGVQCQLDYVACENYDHRTYYALPVRPSPNLPNMHAIYLYPSLCFFEGTVISVGRGTNKQFQLYGHPDSPIGGMAFTPKPMPGAKYPKLEGQLCKGFDLSKMSVDTLKQEARLNLSYLISMYQAFPKRDQFFLKNNFFDKLAGSQRFRAMIQQNITEASIRASWQEEIQTFKVKRSKYLLYPDFE